MTWEPIVALSAIAALALTVWAALRKTHEDVESLQFSLTPIVAIEGGQLEGYGAQRRATYTIHLEGSGFVHNLILNFFVGEEIDTINNPPSILFWLFKRSPAAEGGVFVYQVRDKTPGTDQTVRLEGRYENVFKQEIRFNAGFCEGQNHGWSSRQGLPSTYGRGQPSAGGEDSTCVGFPSGIN